MNDWWQRLITAGVFVFVFLLGLYVASIKPLENDEIHSQIHSIEPFSYTEIFLGKIIGEGNNAPLFYAFQKAFCQITSFTAPSAWREGVRTSNDSRLMILLRLSAIFWGALAVSLIFFYFHKRDSLKAAVYSLIVCFSLSYFWYYLAEARHYSLWIFLTAAQIFFFLEARHQGKFTTQTRIALAWIHVLLALTVFVSVGQILIVSFLVWLFLEKNWKTFLGLAVVPTGICFYYASMVPSYKHLLPSYYLSLIYACFPPEYLIVCLFYGIVFLAFQVGMRQGWLRQDNFLHEKFSLRIAAEILLLVVFMLLFCLAFFGYVLLEKKSAGAGNPIASRYFIFLLPTSVFAVVMASSGLMQLFHRYRWARINIVISLIALTILVFLKNHTLWIYWEFISR